MAMLRHARLNQVDNMYIQSLVSNLLVAPRPDPTIDGGWLHPAAVIPLRTTICPRDGMARSIGHIMKSAAQHCTFGGRSNAIVSS